MAEKLVPKPEHGKPVTVRLPQETLAQLEGLSIIDDVKFADTFRMAVHEYVEHRRTSPDFPEQVNAAHVRRTHFLDALES